MARPASRDSLIQYCLRRLGHPVIEINVDPDQVEDRIDDALQLYQQFHMDAVEHVYYTYVLTPTDITNKYIPIPPNMLSIVSVNQAGTSSGKGLFDVNYQQHMTNWDAFYGSGGGSIVGYDIVMSNLALLNFEFNPAFSYDFNRHQQKLFVRWNWQTDVFSGTTVIAEGYQALDPDTYTAVYNDMWLKKYATELIRRNWGENLMKYSGTALPGGITLNGTDIYQTAIENIEKLEQEIEDKYQLPPMFEVG